MSPGDHGSFEHGSDFLDELLRQTLQDGTPAVQPSQRVWERIRSQVTAGPAPTSHRPPTERLSRQLAPLVQGLAAAVIVVLVGVSLGSTRWTTSQPATPSDPPPAPVAFEPPAAAARVESGQRLGRFAAADDASEYGLSESQQVKPGSQPERVGPPRSTSADFDVDLVVSRWAFAGGSGP
jgi:hypothetical protein